MTEYIADKYGNTVYLTDERWRHIVERHSELEGSREKILTTIRTGARRQDKIFSDTFFYLRRFEGLLFDYTHIKVVVFFRLKNDKPNNFIVTAYLITKH